MDIHMYGTHKIEMMMTLLIRILAGESQIIFPPRPFLKGFSLKRNDSVIPTPK